LSLNSKLGGFAFFVPSQSTNPVDCYGTWKAYIYYAYDGPDEDSYFLDKIKNITSLQKTEFSFRSAYRDMWDKI